MKTPDQAAALFSRRGAGDRYERRVWKYERQLQRLRRRWPMIGAAATHPLTAVAAAWRPRRRWAALTAQTAIALVFGLAVLLLALSVFGLLGLCVAAVVFKYVFRAKTGRPFTLEMEELFRSGSRDALVELWLTPLTYRDLAGIEAGRVWLQSRRATRVLALAVCAVLGCLAFWGIELLGIRPRFGVDFCVFAGGVAALLASIMAYSDDLLLQGAFTKLFYSLKKAEQSTIDSIARGCGLVVAILVVAALMVSGIIGLSLSAGAGGTFRSVLVSVFLWGRRLPYWVLGLGFFGAAAGLVAFARWGLPKWTEARFNKQAPKGQALYESYVGRRLDKP